MSRSHCSKKPRRCGYVYCVCSQSGLNFKGWQNNQSVERHVVGASTSFVICQVFSVSLPFKSCLRGFDFTIKNCQKTKMRVYFSVQGF